jgi:hypothetical protein
VFTGAVFYRVARPLAWPDARENEMTVTTGREVPRDLRGGQGRQGERRAARVAARDKIHRSERGHGVFRRSVTLPSSHVDADRTEASARDGVLEILVPKALGAQAGPIRVRVSQEYAALTPGHHDEERPPC